MFGEQIEAKPYMIEHLLSLLELFAVLTDKATRAASVKASLTPRLRLAEHSIDDVSLNLRTDVILAYPDIGELVFAVRHRDLSCSLPSPSPWPLGRPPRHRRPSVFLEDHT